MTVRSTMPAPSSSEALAIPPAGRLTLSCPVCQTRYPADFKVCPRDAAELVSAVASDDPLIGAVLGGSFRIVRAIGEGGTARVYEARHVRLANKRFAVKVLHGAYAAQPTLLARFQREAESVAGIDHPNVVTVYDVDRTPDGRPYLVSEFLDGADLSSWLKARGELPIAEAVHIVREVCSALATAHARGVVHRDLKPENVFLVGSGEARRVKVLDFGISKLLGGAGEALTHTGMIVGTPAYMSPEQASGAAVDERTDVYGAGAILYRLITGAPAFANGDTALVLSAVLTEEPRRPRALRSTVPDALELVIQRAMAKKPEDRYGSMLELTSALLPFDSLALEALAPNPDAPSPTIGDVTRVRPPSEPSITAELAENVARIGREARRARPNLVVFSLLGYVWLVALSVDAIFAVLTAGKEPDEAAAAARLGGSAIAAAVVLLGPFLLWFRHVAKHWKNGHRALELSVVVKRVALAGIVSYGLAVVAIRLLMATTGQSGFAGGTPRVPLALLLVNLAGASAAYLLTRRNSRTST